MNLINKSLLSRLIQSLHFLIILSNYFLFVKCLDLNQSKDRIKLSQLKILTLQKDNYTNHRRLERAPQLKCKSSPSLCHSFAPSLVQCLNTGYPEDDVNWECSAKLDNRVKFDRLKVICEGYDNEKDNYILSGSCRLDYYLEFNYQLYDYYNKDIYETSKISNFLTLMIMVIVVLTIYKSCIKNRQMAARRDFNETYAQIITDGSDQNVTSTVFPPPPPSYSLAMQNTSKNDENPDKNETTVTLNSVINLPNVSRRSESPPPAYQNSTDPFVCTRR